MNPFRLTIIWVELWAPLLATSAAALTTPWQLSAPIGLIATLLLVKSWRNGALIKNITDTYAEYARWTWRKQRSEYELPKLVAIDVTQPLGVRATLRILRIEGAGSIPANHMRLTVRPADHQGDPTWTAKLENWVARRYGFQVADTVASELSSNLLDITLTQHVLPHMVPAVDDLPDAEVAA